MGSEAVLEAVEVLGRLVETEVLKGCNWLPNLTGERRLERGEYGGLELVPVFKVDESG